MLNEESKLKELIMASSGQEKADLVFKNCKILNVFTKELEEGDIAIKNGYIAGIGDYEGDRVIDVEGKIVCPGLIDGHIHIESSMLSPTEFAKAVIPHGTTAVITDPHEIANVAGSDGISFMLESAKDLPLDVFFMLPSCVPSTPLDEAGAVLDAASLEPFYSNDKVLGLAELMNSFGTVKGDSDIIAKINGAKSNGKVIDGHAPSLTGNELNAYIAAGVASDHECFSFEEARQKLMRGQWIMIRQGTAAKNLEALLPLFDDRYSDRCILVTDDKHPGDLIRQGHIDYIIREAVKAGKSPFNAVKMASFNTANYFGLKDRGAVAPGYRADLIVVSDLNEFKVEKVFKDGILTAEDAKLTKDIESSCLDEAKYKRVFHSFNMSDTDASDFKIKDSGSKKRVIKVVPGQIITEEVIVDSSSAEAEPEKDISKIAVIERHNNTGHIGVGFVTGYGLKKGAIASSVAHDSHNLIVAGTNDEDMALAANTVASNEGGLAVVCDGVVTGQLKLPLAGLMCGRDASEVDEELEMLKEQCRSLGVPEGIDPFMTLAFTALPVIPELRIITKGVVDVNTQSYAPVLFD